MWKNQLQDAHTSRWCLAEVFCAQQACLGISPVAYETFGLVESFNALLRRLSPGETGVRCKHLQGGVVLEERLDVRP